MKQQRLTWLLLLMGVLIVVRWLVPNAPPQSATSEAVARPALTKSAASTPAIAAETKAAAVDTAPAPQSIALPNASPLDFIDTAPPGNAFAIRLPPVVAIAPPSPPVKPVVLPPPSPSPQPPPAPPPPPPLQVIGTWDDGAAPGVFVSTPNGTVLARVGVVLMMEYRVIAVTAQQLTMEQLSSKREIRLPVPRAASR